MNESKNFSLLKCINYIRSICFVIFTFACCCHLKCLYIFIIRFFFFSFAPLSIILYTDQFSFIHRCRFYWVSCLLSTHTYTCWVDKWRKKKRRREEQNGIFTCEHYEWLMLVVIYFFSSLSLDNDWTLMEVKWKLIRPCIRLANRQNENFDCLPDIDTYT